MGQLGIGLAAWPGAVTTIYALSISIFGGTTQLAINGLIRITHNRLAPAWYLARGARPRPRCGTGAA
jgi:hypothetical protein